MQYRFAVTFGTLSMYRLKLLPSDTHCGNLAMLFSFLKMGTTTSSTHAQKWSVTQSGFQSGLRIRSDPGVLVEFGYVFLTEFIITSIFKGEINLEFQITVRSDLLKKTTNTAWQ